MELIPAGMTDICDVGRLYVVFALYGSLYSLRDVGCLSVRGEGGFLEKCQFRGNTFSFS